MPKRINYFVHNGIRVISVCGGSNQSGIISASNDLYLFGSCYSDKKINLSNVAQVAMGDNCAGIIVNTEHSQKLKSKQLKL